MNLRERRLVRRLRARDERAFREMVEAYQDKIFNLTYRMLGNQAEAEDLAQEVFITVFKSIDTFRGDAKLSTWLYRIAANHCKNRIKYLARRHDRERDEFDDSANNGAQAISATSVGPRDQLEGVERELIVQEAIARLDEEHRLLIVLRDIEELSYDEIRTITGLPEGTVKSRLHRARMALRKRLAPQLGPGSPSDG
jgi:RNA polymerase sigma-70 factor, ECF subfamily